MGTGRSLAPSRSRYPDHLAIGVPPPPALPSEGGFRVLARRPPRYKVQRHTEREPRTDDGPYDDLTEDDGRPRMVPDARAITPPHMPRHCLTPVARVSIFEVADLPEAADLGAPDAGAMLLRAI